MTKGELISALQGLTDECPIILRVGYQWMELAEMRYGIAEDNCGLMIGYAGDRVSAPKRIADRENEA